MPFDCESTLARRPTEVESNRVEKHRMGVACERVGRGEMPLRCRVVGGAKRLGAHARERRRASHQSRIIVVTTALAITVRACGIGWILSVM